MTRTTVRRASAVAAAAVVAAILIPSAAFALTAGSRWVSGGYWSYGTDFTSVTQEKCWSNYYHPTKYHSSTARLGTWTMKRYAYAGSTSYATVYGSWLLTGYAYYATY